MNLTHIINITVLSVASFGFNIDAFTSFSTIFFQQQKTTITKRESGASHKFQRAHRHKSKETALEAESSISTTDAVAIFGRLADRAFVPPPTEIQGTAASGYEFGVMEAGRPKWMCTYEERSGKTQGGGNMMRHVPNWKVCLFGEDDVALENRDALREALGNDSVKFQMPLSAPSGAKTAATETPKDEAVIDSLWKLLGGGSSTNRLCSGDVSAALQSAALSHGSSTEDHLTYAIFEKAFLAAASEDA